LTLRRFRNRARDSHADKRKQQLRATVVSVTAATIVVETKKGASDTLAITPSTAVSRGGVTLTTRDGKRDDRVRISVTKDGDRLVEGHRGSAAAEQAQRSNDRSGEEK